MARDNDRSCSCSFTSVIYSSLSTETTITTFANSSHKCGCLHSPKSVLSNRMKKSDLKRFDDEPRFITNERTMIGKDQKQPFVPQTPEPVYKIKASPMQNALHFEAEYCKVDKMDKNKAELAKWVIPTDKQHTPFLSVIFMKGEKQVNYLPVIAEIPSFHRLSSISLDGIQPPQGMIDLLNAVQIPSHISFDGIHRCVAAEQPPRSRLSSSLGGDFASRSCRSTSAPSRTSLATWSQSEGNLQQKWREYFENNGSLYMSDSNTSVFEIVEYTAGCGDSYAESIQSQTSQDRSRSSASQVTVTRGSTHGTHSTRDDPSLAEIQQELDRMAKFLNQEHLSQENMESERAFSTANSISNLSLRRRGTTTAFSDISLITSKSSGGEAVFEYCDEDGPQGLLAYLSHFSQRSLIIASRAFVSLVKKGYSSCRSKGATGPISDVSSLNP